MRVLPGRARDASLPILRLGVAAISIRAERHFVMALCSSRMGRCLSVDGSLPVSGWVIARLRTDKNPSSDGVWKYTGRSRPGYRPSLKLFR
jgi:hypothetical protein